MRGKLFLIPTPIVECDDPFKYMPLYNRQIIESLDIFIVEELRTARRFISKCKFENKVIDSLTFYQLNEHTEELEIAEMIKPLLKGDNVGVMSEAGVPGVADPGAAIVELAHKNDIEVIPLIGPSSILLSLMSSGLNGQSFCFNGYLPVKPGDKVRKIKELEKRVTSLNQTQIFIEAPYRNDKLLEELIKSLNPSTMLCVAANISATDQYIKTYSVSAWRGKKLPFLKKIPTIFLIG